MRVRLSRIASYKLEKILNYLEEDWSLQSKEKFIKMMNSKLEIIKKNPEIYPESKSRPELRKLVITK